MPDITNAEVIKLTNEGLRTMAEKLRALDAQMQALVTTWNTVRVAASVPNDTSALADGRQAEGASRLVGSDLYNLMVIVNGLEAVFATGNCRLYLSKLCVRQLEAS